MNIHIALVGTGREQAPPLFKCGLFDVLYTSLNCPLMIVWKLLQIDEIERLKRNSIWMYDIYLFQTWPDLNWDFEIISFPVNVRILSNNTTDNKIITQAMKD